MRKNTVTGVKYVEMSRRHTRAIADNTWHASEGRTMTKTTKSRN